MITLVPRPTACSLCDSCVCSPQVCCGQVRVGTQPGDTMTLSRYGIKRLNSSGKGDLFVHFKVKIPRSLTERQRELIEEFQQLQEDKNTAVANA